MSTVKTQRTQYGISTNPSNNFVVDASQADGTLKISRGSTGSVLEDVVTVSTTSVFSTPHNPILIARRSGYYQTSANTLVVLPYDAVEVDNTNAYNTTTGRFKPTTPGFYALTYGVVVTGGALSTRIFLSVFKNATEYARSSDAETPGAGANACAGSTVVYLDGVNDYVDIRVWGNNNTAVNSLGSRFTAHFIQG